jgi:hypothetical protein
MRVDLEKLPFERGGALLVKRALRTVAAGEAVTVAGSAADLYVHLRGWCRTEGHGFRMDGDDAVIVRGAALDERWLCAERAGRADPFAEDAVAAHPSQHWGLAPRGALVESGSPRFHFALADKLEVWSPDAVRIYAQAAGSQWDPATASS